MKLEDIRIGILMIIVLIGIIGFLIVFVSLDLTNQNEANENIEKLTGAMVDTAIPTEVSWLARAGDGLQNHPYLLLIVIIFVAWLFGYLKLK